jgi:hypothetical protein
MRAKWVGPFLVLAVLGAACSKPAPHAARTSRPATTPAAQPTDLLVLDEGGPVSAIRAANGSASFSGLGVPALSDWSNLFTATVDGSNTVIRRIEPWTGEATSTVTVPGVLDLRVVSQQGTQAALMAPLPAGASPWNPRPRATTDIVVTDPSDPSATPRTYHLNGNFEPEGFSSDEASLFLVRYVPATAPEAYQVTMLDLAQGKVYRVYTRDKSFTETMAGTRLMQVAQPGGGTLFTLYTSQPSKYAKGHDEAQASAGRPVAFVHTLSLQGGWAHCVPLPTAFWGADARHEAMASSPYGDELFVVDTQRGLVAVMDIANLVIDRKANVDFGPMGSDQTHATLTSDGGTLLVSNGSTVTRLDATSLKPLGPAWPMSGSVRGLGFSRDGLRLYAGLPNEVAMLDPTTGREIRMLSAPGVRDIHYVDTLAA